MKKLLIVGDSLSMSRYREGVTYDGMYSTLLARHFKDWLVINGSLRANTSRRIIDNSYQEEYMLPLLPDLVILQIGVVDCLPRLMSRLERLILSVVSRMWGFRRIGKLYVNFKSKRRLYFTRIKPMAFVSVAEFKDNLTRFRDTICEVGARVVVINIPCPGQQVSQRSYGVNEIVASYNAIIEQVFSDAELLINLHGMTQLKPALLQQDGYHIAEECHKLIFDEILRNRVLDEMTR